MEKFIGQDTPEERRWILISDSADAIENMGYTRRFSAEELNQRKEALANYSIEINDIEEEKKEAMKNFAERLKFPTKQKKLLLKQIKESAEFVTEDCAKYIDQEARIVGYYNRLGELVYTRPIMPQEMQKTTFSINRKTGTED